MEEKEYRKPVSFWPAETKGLNGALQRTVFFFPDEQVRCRINFFRYVYRSRLHSRFSFLVSR